MGCWNGTCSLTNLPIIDGDRVIFFFVENQEAMQGSPNCYHYEMAKPICLPMRGLYNDYGTVDFVDKDIAVELNSKLIPKYLNKIKHKHDFKYEVFDIEEFAKHVERSNCDQTMITGVTMLMVKETIYDDMTDAYKLKDCWHGSPLTYFNEKFELFEADKNKAIPMEHLDLFRWYYFEHTTKSELKKLDADSERYLSIKKVLEHFYLYDSLLGSMRMNYTCGSGGGSQSNDTYLYRRLAEITIKDCDKIDKDCDYDED